MSINNNFYLVLAIWGTAYSSPYVNAIIDSAKKYSPKLNGVILFTDKFRPDINTDVVQKIFPEFFNRPEFYGLGYRVKISIFSKSNLPEGICVYLDLDTLVLGDLGSLASLIKRPTDLFMIPPGNLISFGFIRRLIFKISNGKYFATGNSSVMIFHSAANPNIAEKFEERFKIGDTHRYMTIDDVFISWAGQMDLQAIPKDLAVTFRREFLSRSKVILFWKSISPFRRKKREQIVAITFNGTQYKPEQLLSLNDGDKVLDSKGRHGYWSEKYMGELRKKIINYCNLIINKSKPT